MDNRGSLIERLLQPADSNARGSADINKLCEIIRETSFDIEVKACRGLIDEHIAQLLGYFRASRIEHGLLINFGAQKLQIKKYILTYPI